MCKAIFVPDGCRLNLPKLLQLFNDIWKVKEPSTLVSADAGTVHPVQFATLNLASLPQFKRCWENALKHAEDAFRRSGQEADDEASPAEQKKAKGAAKSAAKAALKKQGGGVIGSTQ